MGWAASTKLLVGIAAADEQNLELVTKGLRALEGGGEDGEEGRGQKALLFVYAECYQHLSLSNEMKTILFKAATRHWKEVRFNES